MIKIWMIIMPLVVAAFPIIFFEITNWIEDFRERHQRKCALEEYEKYKELEKLEELEEYKESSKYYIGYNIPEIPEFSIENFMEHKKEIYSILQDCFSKDELTYAKFANTIENINNCFTNNLQNITEYSKLERNEEINNIIKDYINQNEILLLKLKELKLELVKFKINKNDIYDEKEVLEETDKLISSIKLYQS